MRENFIEGEEIDNVPGFFRDTLFTRKGVEQGGIRHGATGSVGSLKPQDRTEGAKNERQILRCNRKRYASRRTHQNTSGGI